ncbi:MAG: hypothetical protein WKF73_16585 [Nocardioidaceae bacterium]
MAKFGGRYKDGRTDGIFWCFFAASPTSLIRSQLLLPAPTFLKSVGIPSILEVTASNLPSPSKSATAKREL